MTRLQMWFYPERFPDGGFFRSHRCYWVQGIGRVAWGGLRTEGRDEQPWELRLGEALRSEGRPLEEAYPDVLAEIISEMAGEGELWPPTSAFIDQSPDVRDGFLFQPLRRLGWLGAPRPSLAGDVRSGWTLRFVTGPGFSHIFDDVMGTARPLPSPRSHTVEIAPTFEVSHQVEWFVPEPRPAGAPPPEGRPGLPALKPPMPPATFRIMVADGDPDSLERLRRAVHGADGLEVVGQAATVMQVVGQVGALAPDVVLMGFPRSGTGRSGVLTFIRRSSPHTEVVVVVIDADRTAVLDLVRGGASGVLRYDTEASEQAAVTLSVAAIGWRARDLSAVEEDSGILSFGVSRPSRSVVLDRRLLTLFLERRRHSRVMLPGINGVAVRVDRGRQVWLRDSTCEWGRRQRRRRAGSNGAPGTLER